MSWEMHEAAKRIVDGWYAELEYTRKKNAVLGHENAKLRELVRDMWNWCPADGYYCIYHCPRYDKTSESHCELCDRMKELGIEADA